MKQLRIYYLFRLFHLLYSIHRIVYSTNIHDCSYHFYMIYQYFTSLKLVLCYLLFNCFCPLWQCYCLFVQSGKKAHPEQLGVKPSINCTFPPFFPPPAIIIDCNKPLCSMLSALLLLLLLLVSLPALPVGYRPPNTALFGQKTPDWPDTCSTGPGQLISVSGHSNCYFDPSSVSEGLSVASSGLPWTCLSPYDPVEPDIGLIISQVKFWSLYYLSVLETDLGSFLV
jgi:hypothetical protein